MTRRSGTEEDGVIVKVARTGGEVKEVMVNGNRTVEEALEAASIDAGDNDKIRVNGESADFDTVLEKDDKLL